MMSWSISRKVVFRCCDLTMSRVDNPAIFPTMLMYRVSPIGLSGYYYYFGSVSSISSRESIIDHCLLLSHIFHSTRYSVVYLLLSLILLIKWIRPRENQTGRTEYRSQQRLRPLEHSKSYQATSIVASWCIQVGI